VDPLTKSYPYYTPYQFAGNTPIKFIDLDGGEPKDPGNKDVEDRRGVTDKVYKKSGGDDAFMKKSSIFNSGSLQRSGSKDFFANNTNDKFNRYVNTGSQFNVENEDAFGKTGKDVVNTLLGNFIWGHGPENYVFPTDGKISSSLKSSTMVGEALARWDRNNRPDNQTQSWSMDSRGLVNVTLSTGGLLNLPQFLGSVTMKIQKMDNDKIMISIFNITSITSGDLTVSKLFGDNINSVVRNPDAVKQPYYSNISQKFSFTMSTSETDKLINQYGGKK
jgi:hypothetical protein